MAEMFRVAILPQKFFESGVLGMGRSGYMKRQYFFVPPNAKNAQYVHLL